MEFPLLPPGVKLDCKPVDCTRDNPIREELGSVHNEGDPQDPSPLVSTHVEPEASTFIDDYDESDLKPENGIGNIFQQMVMWHMISRGFPTENTNQAQSENFPRSAYLPYDGSGTDHDSDDSKGKGKERAKPLGPSGGVPGFLPGLLNRLLESQRAAMYRSPYAFLETSEEFTDETELDLDDSEDIDMLFPSVQARPRDMFFDALPNRVNQPEFIAGPSRITLDDLR